jgi:cobaltochelatase CobN
MTDAATVARQFLKAPEARRMHIPRIEVRSLDETVEAVDLGQTPAEVVFLSFSDSDLNALARAYEAQPEPKPTLRLASLAALRHP